MKNLKRGGRFDTRETSSSFSLISFCSSLHLSCSWTTWLSRERILVLPSYKACWSRDMRSCSCCNKPSTSKNFFSSFSTLLCFSCASISNLSLSSESVTYVSLSCRVYSSFRWISSCNWVWIWVASMESTFSCYISCSLSCNYFKATFLIASCPFNWELMLLRADCKFPFSELAWVNNPYKQLISLFLALSSFLYWSKDSLRVTFSACTFSRWGLFLMKSKDTSFKVSFIISTLLDIIAFKRLTPTTCKV